jgi:hypothetical protein
MSFENLVVNAGPVAPVAPPIDSTPVVATPANNGVTIIDSKHASIIDSLGRLIKVQRLSAVQKMRLHRFCGAENDRFVGYATLASSVTEFEGQPMAPPLSILAIEAIVARLDDEGITAVAKALTAITPGMGVDAEAAQNLS